LKQKKINFAQILSHCSGLPAWRMVYKDCGEIPPCVVSVDEVEIRRERAKQILQTYDFFNEPNSDVIYSDIGFIWLGFAISAICGNQTFDKCLEELVFRPLHLSVYFNPLSSLDEIKIKNIAPTEFCQWRQRRLKGEVHDENAAAMGGVSSHAGLFGTAKDVAKLASCYLYSTELQLSSELVSQFTCEHSVGKDGMRRGLGWMLKPLSGTVVNTSPCGPKFSDQSFGHTGFTGTSVFCDPKRELIVVLLTNRVYNGRNPDKIIQFRQQIHSQIIDIIDSFQ